MRHKKQRHQINRFTSWHKATIASIARSLLLHQSIRTTKAKAKASQTLAETLISLGKDNSLAARRRAFSILGDHRLVRLLFTDIAPRFNKRSSGYTRILNLGLRRGDGAQAVIFELTEQKQKELKKPKKQKPKSEATPAHEEKARPEGQPKERPAAVTKKPAKGFLKGIRNIFKKERDSL